MKKRHLNGFARIVAVMPAALALTASVCAAGDFVYVDTTATLSYTTLVGPTPIPGLALILPASTSNFNTAVVTLNMPNLFLSEPTSKTIPMAATMQIVAPLTQGGTVVNSGGIGCDNANVTVSGTKPFTLVLKVPLGTVSQPVEAEWFSNGTSTVTTQNYASLSAILVKE